MAAWMIFRTKEWFWAAQLMVTINIVIQLFVIYVVFIPFYLEGAYHTHLVARSFAGITILDFLDNGSVALGCSGPPPVPVQILTVVLFTFLAMRCSPCFACFLFYDVLALFAGQPTWRPALATAVGALGLVVTVRCGYILLTDDSEEF